MMKGPPDPGTPAWSELLMHIVIAARIEPELWSESDALESDGWLARKYLSTLTPAWAEEVYGQEVSVVVITDGEAITINEGKRSTGSKGRGIGILVGVGKNEVSLDEGIKKERPAKNAGRSSHWIPRSFSSETDPAGLKRNITPPEFWIPAG